MHAVLIDFHFFAYSVQLANALTELCEVTLLLPEQAPESYVQALRKEVSLRPFHLPRRRNPSSLRMVYSLFQTISRLQPQVAHLVGLHQWVEWALPLFPRIPLVATIHDVSQHPGDKESAHWVPAWFWARPDQFIVHAESLKRQLRAVRGVPEEKAHVIPHGSYDFYTHWASQEAQERAHTILFFGRIWEYKGLQYLIEAEPLITSRVPEARIVIAGHGEPFERYARLMVHPEHFVVHNYRIPDEMIAPLFQQASLVVLPYIEASQSGVTAVAYAFGKPVVATTVGGIPEVVEHGGTGYLVPPRDARSLADAIVTLLQDHPLRRRMGRRALAKSQSEFSWSGIAAKTMQAYQQALEAHARAFTQRPRCSSGLSSRNQANGG
jgi:glycosyltransferase involved in cell wall biosynthesis